MVAVSTGNMIKLAWWQWLLRHWRARRDKCVVCGMNACFLVAIQGERYRPSLPYGKPSDGKLPVCPGHFPPFFKDDVTYKKGVNSKKLQDD